MTSTTLTAMPPPVHLAAIRLRASDMLGRLEASHISRFRGFALSDGANGSDPKVDRLQTAIGVLGRIASGLAVIDTDALPQHRAGYGSRVTVYDLDAGGYSEYTLMSGTAMELDSNEVSLASPIGQALLGCSRGDVLMIRTPHRDARMRVVTVRTLEQVLDSIELELLDA